MEEVCYHDFSIEDSQMTSKVVITLLASLDKKSSPDIPMNIHLLRTCLESFQEYSQEG